MDVTCRTVMQLPLSLHQSMTQHHHDFWGFWFFYFFLEKVFTCDSIQLEASWADLLPLTYGLQHSPSRGFFLFSVVA
jgi:hypothetical protein